MTDYESVTSKISLDFAQRTSPVTVFAKQGDENTRHITITPLANGVPMSLGNDEHFVARFAAKKPDGTYVYNDSASICADGLINVTLTDQTLAAHGNALCCIVLTNNDGKTLTSQNFTLIIEYSAGAYENLASSDEILGIDGKLEELNKLIEDIESMLGEGVFNAKAIPHMRFSAYADGTGFSETWSAGMNYIGFAIAETAPAQKEEYTWAQFASNVRDTIRVTLKANAWENNLQTVDCKAILEKSSAWSSYAPDYKIEYINYGVSIKSASVGKATFECVTTPALDIDVMLTITDPLAAAGSADVQDGEQPTDSKYVMRDQQGNLSAVNPKYPDFPNLLYSYTHAANREIHAEALDLATGVFTSTGHGLTSNQKVFVAVHAPYHLGKPYDCLPGGLILGNPTGNNAKQYYVNVVDENSFTISEKSGEAAVTFTSVSGMDLSKFHFECQEAQKIALSNLPDFDACKVVINGRIGTVYRYVVPSPSVKYSGKMGGAGYDSFSTNYQTEIYGGVHLGAYGGHGSELAEMEIRIIRPGHILIKTNEDVLAYDQTNAAKAQHNRKYTHWNTNATAINKITFDEGQFFNGTTVEVYVE